MILCDDPNDLHRLFIVSLLKNQMLEALSLYHADAIFVVGNNGEVAAGREGILAQLQAFQAVAPKMELLEKSLYRAGRNALIKLRWKISGEAAEYTALDVLTKNDDDMWQFLIDNPYGV